MFSNSIIIYQIITELYIKHCLLEEIFIPPGLVLTYNSILETSLEAFTNLWAQSTVICEPNLMKSMSFILLYLLTSVT